MKWSIPHRKGTSGDEHAWQEWRASNKPYGDRELGEWETSIDPKRFKRPMSSASPIAALLPKYTIDRIDNNGHYEPGNIRWTTRLIQARNRRNNVVVRVGGATMCISAAAELFGIPQQRLERRIRKGWGDEEAVLTPKLESSHRRLSKERRKNVSLSVKLAAALLTITREVEGRLIPVISYDEAKQMTAEQIIARFEFDHGIHHSLGGPAEPWNLTPLPKAEHREKTNKIDRPLLAKVVRLERQRAGLPKRKRMIKKIPNRPNSWPKGRKLQSRNTFRRD